MYARRVEVWRRFFADYADGGGGGGGGGINPLALLVAPLAGIALLSAAAAVALNPVLVSISVTNGKRKKREAGDEYDNDLIQQYMTADMEEKIEEMKVRVVIFILALVLQGDMTS